MKQNKIYDGLWTTWELVLIILFYVQLPTYKAGNFGSKPQHNTQSSRD